MLINKLIPAPRELTRRGLCLLAALAGMGWPPLENCHAAETGPPPGLVAMARDAQRTVTFAVPGPDFTLAENQSIHPRIAPQFTVEFTGRLLVPRDGQYTISAAGRLFLDGQPVPAQATPLTAGYHELRVAYERKPGTARQQVTWQSDFLPLEPIPYTAWFQPVSPPPLAADAEIETGRRLAEEYNCTACHPAPSQVELKWKGPVLHGIGTRASRAWIFKWLENPRLFQTNAAMPVLLETVADRADAAAFLAELKSPGAAADWPGINPALIKQGRELYDSIGCTACHTTGQWALTGLGSKMPLPELAAFLGGPVAVDPSGRMPHLALTREEAASLAVYLGQSRRPEFEADPPAGNAVRGRQLVVESGCLNCHALEAKGPVESALKAPPRERLDPGSGCLAERVAGKAPRYELRPAERRALQAWVKNPGGHPAPLQDCQRRLDFYQCNTCHALNGSSRVVFQRPPPPLTETGEKLRAGGLEQIFAQKKRTRPWLALRMPDFGPETMRPLIPLFAASAGASPGDGEPFPPGPPEQAAAGLKLIGRGEGGLSCINCHDFRGEKAQAEMRGPDLVDMSARLRGDWVKRWWRDPGRHVPGTAMPAFFSEIASAQAENLMDQLLCALAAGPGMPDPVGLTNAAQSCVVKVTDQPVVIRCFLTNASPRSIAVGLPGRQSYCFDAAAVYLRCAWKGDFLDMRPTWTDRGGLPPRVLGAIYYTAPEWLPLRLGNPDAEPQARFKGYQLVQGIPEFLYTLNGVPVRERITAASGASGLLRSFELGPTEQEVWFLAGDPGGLKITCSAGAFEQGRVRIPGGGRVRFEVKITEPAKDYE